MKSKLPEFERAKVMVVGDIMLDRYWFGSTDRIAPEAPVPVVKIKNISERPGGAANVAMNIAALGVDTHLAGLTGIDDASSYLSKTLEEFNVKCSLISLSAHSTNIKIRVISHNQQLIRLDFEQEFEGINLDVLYQRINQSLRDVDLIVLSDYAKGTLRNVQKIIQLARKSGVSVLIDPKGTDFNRYRGATILTPNLFELEAVVGKCVCEKEIIDRGMKLVIDLELSALLITRSEQGMTLLQSGKKPIHMPAQTREVYDVTGAGDTVISVLAATLASGNSLEEACYFANIAAGIVINKIGTSTISSIELEHAMLLNHSKDRFGIVTESELQTAIIIARKRGEKVVMTNGVFDILHAGHVSYLKNARRLGDRLIVAVNSDDSTSRIKGKTRPINPLKQRMIMLSALRSVDWVVSFDEETPQRLISNILPDVLVKGGDYKPDQIVGRKEVLDNGGEVMSLNFENGYSTSKFLNKIQDDRK